MGIFGRKSEGEHGRRRSRDDADREGDRQQEPEEDAGIRLDDDLVSGEHGPFDAADAPDDELPRIDLGSVRVPVPDGAQVQVEMDNESGGVRAVHVLTEQGQVTVSAYAAPRSGGLWREVADELSEQLKRDGAKVSAGLGEWGMELSALLGDVTLRFIGVDGPRWMLRGVIAASHATAADAPDMLRDIMRSTIVDRGIDPMPPRTPLPIKLPQAVADHIAEQQG